MRAQIEAGYMRRNGDAYCATRTGSLKMALKTLRPAAALRIRLARRKAEQFLAETGL